MAQRRQSRAAHLYDAVADDAPDHHAVAGPGLSRRIAWQNTAYNQPPHTGFYLGMTKASDTPE